MLQFSNFAAAALALSFVVTACSIKREDNKFQYNFTENQCPTGSHEFSSKGEYCAALKNEALNNGCARGMRRERYQAECGQDFSAGALQSASLTEESAPGLLREHDEPSPALADQLTEN